MSQYSSDSGINLNEENLDIPPLKLLKAKSKFLIFSAIGVLLFLTPLYWDEKWTIGIGILAESVKPSLADYFSTIALTMVVVSALLTLFAVIFKPAWAEGEGALARIFGVGWLWVVLRTLGAIFITIIYLQHGPEWVTSHSVPAMQQFFAWIANTISPEMAKFLETVLSGWIGNRYTGGSILIDLNPTLIPFFFFAVILLPFLVDYGLMEYIGTILSKPFRFIFKLPGRSAIDASASWLGAAPVGVLITSQQYDKGYYSQKDASIIATNFSLASAAFCLVILTTIGIPQLFVPFYLTTIVTGIIAAVIVARLPPLSFKKNIYATGEGATLHEAYPDGESAHTWASKRALARAHRSPNIFVALKNGFVVLADVYLGLMPVVFAIGTMALALSEYTTIFNIISEPMVPYLELLGVPEAVKAAPTMLVGFADMFLPAVLGKGIDNDMTKFVIAAMSVLQIIYMTEVGALILKAKIGLNILELFIIFIIRTLICLPIVVLIAKTMVFNA